MYNLSEQAQKLIEEFEKRIETVPADERNAILKRMTLHIATLNEEAKGLYQILRSPTDDDENDISHVNDAF